MNTSLLKRQLLSMQALFDIRYSYWFIPTVMAFGAVMLAASLVAIDLYYLSEIPKSLDWLFSSKPDGARAILSTVAGSTITVAGVVFSMMIMSVSHATANYGSRLLLQFLKDRKNQVALGTFTATFIYCLQVLRTVTAERGKELLVRLDHMFPKDNDEHNGNDDVTRSVPQEQLDGGLIGKPYCVSADQTGTYKH